MIFWDIFICICFGALLVGSLAILVVRAQRRSGRGRRLVGRGGSAWEGLVWPTVAPAFFGGVFALFVVLHSRPGADLRREFLLFAFFFAWAGTHFFVSAVRLARRTRYTLGEFVVLVTLTGLGIGLTAKALPAELHPALAAAPTVLIGISLFSGGLCGLYVARWLGVESPRRRIFLLLRGLLLAPALGGVIAAGVAAVVLFGRAGETGETEIRSILLAAALVLGAAASLILFATTYRLVERAREAERYWRKAEEAAQELPPEVEEPPASGGAAED